MCVLGEVYKNSPNEVMWYFTLIYLSLYQFHHESNHTERMQNSLNQTSNHSEVYHHDSKSSKRSFSKSSSTLETFDPLSKGSEKFKNNATMRKVDSRAALLNFHPAIKFKTSIVKTLFNSANYSQDKTNDSHQRNTAKELRVERSLRTMSNELLNLPVVDPEFVEDFEESDTDAWISSQSETTKFPQFRYHRKKTKRLHSKRNFPNVPSLSGGSKLKLIFFSSTKPSKRKKDINSKNHLNRNPLSSNGEANKNLFHKTSYHDSESTNSGLEIETENLSQKTSRKLFTPRLTPRKSSLKRKIQTPTENSVLSSFPTKKKINRTSLCEEQRTPKP